MEEFFESVVCPGCGCLCDDLDVRVADGRVQEVANGCTWGVARFFLGHKSQPKRRRFRLEGPFIRRQGRAVDTDLAEALDEAAKILRRAQRVLVYGLGSLSLEAQQRAIALARGLSGSIEAPDLAVYSLYFEALKSTGGLWCGLDGVRDRAEVVIFWGANPIHSAPRLPARYAVFARGRFTPTGVEERRAFSVDIGKTETDSFTGPIKVSPGEDLELARGLAAAAGGDEGALASLPERGQEMFSAAQDAEFGVLFLGRGAAYGPAPGELISHLAAFASNTGLAVVVLSPDYNTFGLISLLVSQGFSPSSLVPEPGGSFIESPNGYDAVLVAGADPVFFMSEEAKAGLLDAGVEVVSLNSFTDYTTRFARVAIPCGLFGVEEEGEALRVDGALLRLRALVPSALPNTTEVLRRIEEGVCA